jgi:hypothetical protein
VVAKDTTFTTVVAHDEDFNQQLFYLLTPDTGIAPNAQIFFGVRSAGQFYLKHDELNFEQSGPIEVSITAQDNGSPRLSDEAIMHVTVLDVNERPRINPDHTYSILENGVGTLVSPEIDCIDPDNDMLELTVVHGKSSGSAYFIANNLHLETGT